MLRLEVYFKSRSEIELKIEAAAKLTRISSATIRYYEREGLVGPIKRINGVREIEQTDLDRLDFILCVKRCGMTLGQIKHFITIFQQGDQTIPERLTILQNQLVASEQKALELQASIRHLKTKINDVKALL